MKDKAKEVLKIAGEVFVTPGTSLLVGGKWKEGAAHVGLGLLGKALLGLPGVVLIGANSYLTSLEKSKQRDANKAEANQDQPRCEGLDQKVRKEMAEGLSLEEVQAGIAEDVEDVYFEAQEEAEFTSDQTVLEVPEKTEHPPGKEPDKA